VYIIRDKAGFLDEHHVEVKKFLLTLPLYPQRKCIGQRLLVKEK
jgi:hypothetical protein